MPPEISQIHHALKAVAPNLPFACVSARVSVRKHNEALWLEIDQHLAHLSSTIKPEQIKTFRRLLPCAPHTKLWAKILHAIADRRKRCCVACCRAKGLYQINSVVDINNLVSLESLNPAGTYDLEKITPPIELRIGAAGESYKGIGKDLINIESLPVFADARRPFRQPNQ